MITPTQEKVLDYVLKQNQRFRITNPSFITKAIRIQAKLLNHPLSDADTDNYLQNNGLPLH